MYPAAMSREILCVDDDQSILKLAAEILRTEGLTVWTAECGEQAIHIAQNDAGICLATLDWHMPGMDGVQVAEQLHAINPDLSVIVLSADHPSKVREAFAHRRVAHFLHKPFTPRTLASAVGAVLARVRMQCGVEGMDQRQLRRTG